MLKINTVQSDVSHVVMSVVCLVVCLIDVGCSLIILRSDYTDTVFIVLTQGDRPLVSPPTAVMLLHLDHLYVPLPPSPLLQNRSSACASVPIIIASFMEILNFLIRFVLQLNYHDLQNFHFFTVETLISSSQAKGYTSIKRDSRRFLKN